MVRGLSVLVFLALAASAAAAVLSAGGEAARTQASAIAADGSFSFYNSRDGMPIFSATEIVPGDSVSGSVEVTDTGSEPGELVLAQHDVTDTPGPGGGLLSERLSMRITDVTAPANPVTVYAGPMAPMPARPAARIAAGGERTYEFVATLPEGAAAGGAGSQNDVQGASASVAYSWTAGEVRPDPIPPASPPSRPSPSQPLSGSTPAGGEGSGAVAPLRLAITRVRRSIRHGRLLVLARCDKPCAISGRGRLRAGGAAGHRTAKLRLSRRPRYVAGTQRLKIRVPARIRHWLHTHSNGARAKVRIVLVAHDLAGETARARRAVRLRHVADRAAKRLARGPRANR